MASNRLQEFFGDNIEETWDSIRSVPGAFGNILLASLRQIRPLDIAALGLVVAGLVWFCVGYVFADERSYLSLALSLLPLLLWLIAGLVGGFVFQIGAIGRHSLAYWESYVLLALFAMFGVISLRLALDPRDRRVYRATTTSRDL
jgi:hypothetical protein